MWSIHRQAVAFWWWWYERIQHYIINIRTGIVFPVFCCSRFGSLSFLFLPVGRGTRCGLFLQRSICCVFRVALLHIMVKMSAWGEYANSTQDELNQYIQTTVVSTFAAAMLPLFGQFSINPRDGSAVSKTLTPTATFSITYITFLPHIDALFELEWNILVMFTCLM